MQQFGGPLSDNVDSEQFLGRGIENEFQSSGGVAANLSTSNLPEIGQPEFVRNALVSKLLFGFADERNFRNGVNPIRIIRAVGIRGHTERSGGGDAPLFHGDGAEARKSDYISHGKNMQLLGAVIFIDGDAASRVRF